MCKFCDSSLHMISQNLPDEGYNHFDSAQYFLFGDNYMHINPQYVDNFDAAKQNIGYHDGLIRHTPIFNIRIKFCPFCGKQLNYNNRDDNYDFDIN